MTDYEHTQPGTLIRALMGGGALAALGIAAALAMDSRGLAWPPLAIAAALLAALALFHSLTVKVTREAISLRFGVGLIHKQFATADIESATIVRNRWWYGWGIRLTPHGWLFNVSGLNAVELHMQTRKTYRIGTDEPTRLLAAIEAVLEVLRAGREG